MTHPKKGIIIIAEYSLNPKVFIYSYPSKKLLKTLESKDSFYYTIILFLSCLCLCSVQIDVSELQINQMDLSFDAKKLLVVTGVPKYEIQVYDLESGSKLEGYTSTIPVRNKFIKA